MSASPDASGCLLCGAELVYRSRPEPLACVYCGCVEPTHAACANGHFVCDRCHTSGALEVIEAGCRHGSESDPLRLAEQLMRHPAVKMHGPEHHFLAAAVLIAAARRQRGETARLTEDLAVARQRAADVKGGVCGLHGSCGAAIGAGIACSVLTGATPLAKEEWRLANLTTATALAAIAEAGGPRCCKRDVFLAVRTAAEFFNRHLGTRLALPATIHCIFSERNRECLAARCPFFPAALPATDSR